MPLFARDQDHAHFCHFRKHFFAYCVPTPALIPGPIGLEPLWSPDFGPLVPLGLGPTWAPRSALAQMAIKIEKHYGRPVDIEWARDGDDGPEMRKKRPPRRQRPPDGAKPPGQGPTSVMSAPV